MAHRKPTILTLLLLILAGIGLGALYKLSRFIAEANAPVAAAVVLPPPTVPPAVPRAAYEIPRRPLTEAERRRARRELIGKERAREPDVWAQRKTQQKMLEMGKALEGWQRTADADHLYDADLEWVSDEYYRLPFDDLEAMIQPPGSQTFELIRKDGWGQDFEFLIELGEDVDPWSLVIRSAGSDGLFEDLDLNAPDFPQSHTERDIVWRAGYVVVEPRADLDDR